MTEFAKIEQNRSCFSKSRFTHPEIFDCLSALGNLYFFTENLDVLLKMNRESRFLNPSFGILGTWVLRNSHPRFPMVEKGGWDWIQLTLDDPG
jgi:hypothetical protein